MSSFCDPSKKEMAGMWVISPFWAVKLTPWVSHLNMCEGRKVNQGTRRQRDLWSRGGCLQLREGAELTPHFVLNTLSPLGRILSFPFSTELDFTMLQCSPRYIHTKAYICVFVAICPNYLKVDQNMSSAKWQNFPNIKSQAGIGYNVMTRIKMRPKGRGRN